MKPKEFIAIIEAWKIVTLLVALRTKPNRDPVAIKTCMQSVFLHLIVTLTKQQAPPFRHYVEDLTAVVQVQTILDIIAKRLTCLILKVNEKTVVENKE